METIKTNVPTYDNNNPPKHFKTVYLYLYSTCSQDCNHRSFWWLIPNIDKDVLIIRFKYQSVIHANNSDL